MAIVDVIVVFAIAAPSIILHEVSHGWAALRLGDDTAQRAGRLTLNPLAHVDPVGTLLLPAVLALSGFGVIGYAKPVPVNVRRLRRPRDHAVLGVAGVINLLLAFFNLLPIPPLDGSAVVERAIPTRWLRTWYRLRVYSMFVLIGLVLFLGVGELVIDPAIDVFEALAG